ncbi:methyltransferase domain-containing protein [Brevibacillus fluminis]|uniref:Methyltransferase domain-containing protein n=1 Tax=Brevibacillus fluminis TaxID=511487 RepID=A0A3M8DTR3_9BACL|nr:50S ribosomal protein L11 methyltransferase [Brevibacillus fluminis]RNB90367.1 methyltransferase domain-containing protein [Brevibacillus fluminis]
MSRFWLKYTISLPADLEEVFLAELLDSTYTLGWTEPQIEVIVTENGYDYQEQPEQPVIAYVFEPMEEEQQALVARMEEYLQRWEGAICLKAVEQVKEENESWKDEFVPVQIGSLTVAPSWTKETLQDAGPVLWIDPGAAFGTGYHGTTQDMLRFLQEMDVTGMRVIDIGAGSGILSIYCALHHAKKPVYALDLNPESEYEIRQNLAHNELDASSVEVVIGDATSPDMAERIPEKADLILLNIGGDEDVAILPLVGKLLAPDGTVIFSGLVEWNREAIADKLVTEGYSIKDQRQTDEWVTLMAKAAR